MISLSLRVHMRNMPRKSNSRKSLSCNETKRREFLRIEIYCIKFPLRSISPTNGRYMIVILAFTFRVTRLEIVSRRFAETSVDYYNIVMKKKGGDGIRELGAPTGNVVKADAC